MKSHITFLLLFLSLFLQAQTIPDPSFGNNGVINPGGRYNTAILVQPDGKVITIGTQSNGPFSNFEIRRYKANGTYDNQFGTSGGVLTGFDNYDVANAIDGCLQNDGKIIIVGNVKTEQTFQGKSDYALVRYNADGTLDETFGTGGKVTINMNSDTESATCVAVSLEDDILIGGTKGVVKLKSNGKIDTTYATQGKILNIPPVNCLEIFNNNLYVAGGNTDIFVGNYKPNGQPNGIFGNNGVMITDFGGIETALSMAVLDFGIVAIAGKTGSSALLARFNYFGVDQTFGIAGKVVTKNGLENSAFGSMVVQNDTLLLIGGFRSNNFDANFEIIAARYKLNGTPDNSFGTNGLFATGLDNGFLSELTNNDLALTESNEIFVMSTIYIGKYVQNTSGTLAPLSSCLDKLRVSPNPAFETLTIEGDINLEGQYGQYILTNMFGKPILHGRLESLPKTIDIGLLNSGTYLLDLKAEGGLGHSVLKFIKL